MGLHLLFLVSDDLWMFCVCDVLLRLIWKEITILSQEIFFIRSLFWRILLSTFSCVSVFRVELKAHISRNPETLTRLVNPEQPHIQTKTNTVCVLHNCVSFIWGIEEIHDDYAQGLYLSRRLSWLTQLVDTWFVTLTINRELTECTSCGMHYQLN